MIETILMVLVLGLASYRITRFLVTDTLMGMGPDSGSWLSTKVDAFAYNPDGSNRSWWRGKIGDLLTCYYCLGFWVSCAGLAVWTRTWPWTADQPGQWVLLAFAIAGVQSFVSSRMNA